MTRASTIVVASMFVASLAHAQPKPVEKCTGNFEEAQMKEKRGKLSEAEELYGLCAVTSCPSMVRADCTAKRDEVARRVPTATVVVRDATGNDVVAKVSIDGKPLTDRTHAQPIDPGEHTITYEIDGKPSATQKVTAVEGEKARVIIITLKSEPKPAPPPSAKTESAEGPAVVGPLVVGTVGLVLIGTAVIMQVLAISEDSKADEFRTQAADPNTPASDRLELERTAQSRQSSAESNQRLAIITGLGGLLFIGGGLAWYFVTKPKAESKTPEPKRATFTPAIAPGYAGASFGLAF